MGDKGCTDGGIVKKDKVNSKSFTFLSSSMGIFGLDNPTNERLREEIVNGNRAVRKRDTRRESL